MRAAFAETIDRDEVAAYVASFFAPGFADIPAFFVEDALRTDGRARAGISGGIGSGGNHDETVIVRDLKAPLAVLHGAEDQLVNGAYFASLTMPTLWRGSVQTIPGAGHARMARFARSRSAASMDGSLRAWRRSRFGAAHHIFAQGQFARGETIWLIS